MASAVVVEYERAPEGTDFRETDAGLSGDSTAAVCPPEASRNRKRIVSAVVFLIVGAAAVAAGVVAVRNNRNSNNASSSASASGNSTTGSGPRRNTTGTTQQQSSSLPTVAPGPPRVHEVTVVKATPHDAKAFLQGFEYDAQRKQFFESTGLTRGRSSLRRVEIETGKVLLNTSLQSPSEFGEGMTLVGTDRVVMLTWRAQKGYVFNQSSFEVLSTWNYSGEGWGLTMDRAGNEIYMSDGTSQIRILDPDTLQEKRRINVTRESQPVSQLNELEWICGEVWANIWMANDIVRIDPSTGVIRSIIRVRGLPRQEDIVTTPNVLNGIAFDNETRRLWITGKLWPKVYQVTIDDDLFAKQCGG